MTIAFSTAKDTITIGTPGEKYMGGAGDDVYIISNYTTSAGDAITIDDTEGANKIQLVDGLSITSSTVLANALELTLSNGAVVRVLGASSFDFEVGGNETTGTVGTVKTYNDFVVEDLGTTVPAAGDPASTGGAVVISNTPKVSVSAPAEVQEGNDAVYTVTLTKAQATDVTVDYALTFEGGADAADLEAGTPLTGTVTIAAGATEATVAVPVFADAVSEPGEAVKLTLSNVAGGDGVELDTASATTTITDAEQSYSIEAAGNGKAAEGESLTFTIKSLLPVAQDTTLDVTVLAGDPTGADQGTDKTNMNDFEQATFNTQTVTIAAGTTEATFTVTGKEDTITEYEEAYNVEAKIGDELVATVEGIVLDGSSGGKTYELKGGLDDLDGTSGDDTFVADETDGTAKFEVIDTLDGLEGTDTLKLYKAAATALETQAFGTLTNIEKMHIINGTLTNTKTLDLTQAGSVKEVTIDSPAEMADADAFTFKGAADQTLKLVAVKGTAAGATSTVTTNGIKSLTLNGFNTDVTLDVKAASTTAMDLLVEGASSKFTLTNTATKLAALNISGDKALTLTEALATLKTIDASALTADLTLDVKGAAGDLTFTGGSGDDTITFAATELTDKDVLDGGAGTDTLDVADLPYAAINAAQNFEVLSLFDTANVDVSKLTTLNTFKAEGAVTVTVSEAKDSTTVISDATTAAVTKVTVNNQVGENSTNLKLIANAAGTNAHTAVDVSGISTVNIESTGPGKNVITTLTNDDNSNFVVTGSQDLVFALATATGTGSKVDASAFTGKLDITGNNTAFAAGSPLGDIIIGGSGDDTIKAAVNGGEYTGGAGKDTFDVSAALGGDETNYQTTLITDAEAGDAIKFAGTAGAFDATEIDLSGAADEKGALNLLVAGNNTDLKWGVYEGNTYICDDAAAGNTFAAADTMVKLAGVYDLSEATFAANTLTLA